MDFRRGNTTAAKNLYNLGYFVGDYNMLLRIKYCGCSMLVARASTQFGRRQLDGDRKRLWRGRETSRRFNRIRRADLNESGTEQQSKTVMSKIVQVSGNGNKTPHNTGLEFRKRGMLVTRRSNPHHRQGTTPRPQRGPLSCVSSVPSSELTPRPLQPRGLLQKPLSSAALGAPSRLPRTPAQTRPY